MAARIALLGTYETKSQELALLAGLLRSMGLEVMKVDLSLACAGEILTGDQKISRMAAQTSEAETALLRDQPAAVLAVGGGTGSEMALAAMRELPMGTAKFLITTLPFDPRDAVADNSITLIPTLCDIQGVNSVLHEVFTRAAAMVAGVVNRPASAPDIKANVAVSVLGVTQKAAEAVIDGLQEGNVAATCFHAAGHGGAAMVRFIKAGYFAGVIDMTVQEAVRLHVGGFHIPMPCRFTAAGHLPRVVLPGALNFLDGGRLSDLSPEHLGRAHYRHTAHFTHVKLTKPEAETATLAIAHDLNQSRAPCEVILPMGGLSSEDRPGGAIEDPELREHIASIFESEAQRYSTRRINGHINDPQTGKIASAHILSHLESEPHVQYP